MMNRGDRRGNPWTVWLVACGVALQGSPVAWAQLETADPALYAAVEALVAHDPEVVGDPELAQICHDVAEATVFDPRERAAVTYEVAEIHREGVDLNTVIPPEVREAAREQFEQVQGQMREQLEALRASDPEAAREVELMMRESEQCMRAFEQGESYTPSPEMVAHAREMFNEWETDARTQGASSEYLERARAEFTHWSSGETDMAGMMGGPGHEMMGPGAPGEMPSLEQMETMVASGQMSPEQLQMAKEYMEGGFEHMGPMGFEGMAPTEYQGMSPNEAFEHWTANESQQFSPAQMEQYTMEFENQNYDSTQQTQFDQLQPTPGGGGEVLVASHDHNSDGMLDEYHYDTNGDHIADHAHPTPH